MKKIECKVALKCSNEALSRETDLLNRLYTFMIKPHLEYEV